METKAFQYKGKRIVYHTQGNGPLVVLLHGFGENSSAWKNQFDLFPNHQLLVPDLPGSGDSEMIDDMSLEGMADCVYALMSLTPNPSPDREGSKDIGGLNEASDRQENSSHFFKTADPAFWEKAKEYGRRNRKEPTAAEDLLWQNLRNNHLGVKVRRQHSIGGFIVDFAALEKKLVIEVDGGYHQNPEQQALDLPRQMSLEKSGYTVLRFTNEQVLHHLHDVLQTIKKQLSELGKDEPVADTPPLSVRRGVGGEAMAILIGHSMGGYITLAFVEKYGEALKAFGLFHSTAFADSEEKKETRRKGIEKIKSEGSEAFLKGFVSNLYAPATKADRPGLLEEHLQAVSSVSAEPLVRYFEAMMQRPDRTSLLKETALPVLFVMGKHDTAVPVEDGLKQCHLPQIAYIHLLQHSGHMGMVEEVEETNNILIDFIKMVGLRRVK